MTASLRDLQRAMIDEIRSPAGSGLYRTLVRRGLADMLRYQLPRTAAHLGDRWNEDVTWYLDATLSRSHYLRDAAFEFFARIAPRWSADPSVPPYIVDLARFELLAFEVRNAPDDPEIASPQPLALDRRVGISLAARVVRSAHAVHLLDDDEDSREPPAAESVILCAYRDADLEMRTLVLTRSAAEILERLLAGAPLGEAVSGAAAACSVALDPPFLQGAARLLEDLGERGVVRGAA